MSHLRNALGLRKLAEEDLSNAAEVEQLAKADAEAARNETLSNDMKVQHNMAMLDPEYRIPGIKAIPYQGTNWKPDFDLGVPGSGLGMTNGMADSVRSLLGKAAVAEYQDADNSAAVDAVKQAIKARFLSNMGVGAGVGAAVGAGGGLGLYHLLRKGKPTLTGNLLSGIGGAALGGLAGTGVGILATDVENARSEGLFNHFKQSLKKNASSWDNVGQNAAIGAGVAGTAAALVSSKNRVRNTLLGALGGGILGGVGTYGYNKYQAAKNVAALRDSILSAGALGGKGSKAYKAVQLAKAQAAEQAYNDFTGRNIFNKHRGEVNATSAQLPANKKQALTSAAKLYAPSLGQRLADVASAVADARQRKAIAADERAMKEDQEILGYSNNL